MNTVYLILIAVPLLLGIYAQMKVHSAFGKYKKIKASSGITGAQAAQRILDAAGIRDVEVSSTDGFLGDHYDPIKKRLCLSPDVYSTPSVASLGIAAHEAGHAIQHARSYAPLKARMAIVPVTQASSQLLPLVIIGGFMFQISALITVGIVCYALLAVFQLITLPVEFDASRRAKIILRRLKLIDGSAEEAGVNSVLGAAALTYVAAFVAALGNLAYLILARRS
jgi:Zn-dependent membrane protease YugP